MSEVKRNSSGRPSLYDPAFCERVIEMGHEGYSKAQMAVELGVVRQTLDTWTQQHPEFLDAVSRALDAAQTWWETEGRKGMWAGKQFNAAVWARSMAARFPGDYSERQKLELTGANGGPIQLSETERASRLAGLLAVAKARAAGDDCDLV